MRERRTVRLQGYDYSQAGAYFVTMCSRDRECVFGEVSDDGTIQLSARGGIVREEWLRSAVIRQELTVDEYVIMPNHLHGIVIIGESADRRPVGAHGRAPLRRAPRSLGSFIAGFKSAATKRIHQMGNTPGQPLWQRNYYEQVIRNEDELNRAREYIQNNPLRWHLGRDNPEREPELAGAHVRDPEFVLGSCAPAQP